MNEQAQLRAQLEQRGESSDANQVQRVLGVRAELAKDVPELSDPNDWGDVLQTIEKIGDLPKYAGWDTDAAILRRLILDASVIALDVGERAQTSPTPSHGAASRGMVELSGRGASRLPSASADPEAARRAQFVALMQKSTRAMSGLN